MRLTHTRADNATGPDVRQRAHKSALFNRQRGEMGGYRRTGARSSSIAAAAR
jgi:hypothetical protein